VPRDHRSLGLPKGQTPSPYELVLGDELSHLHPRLQQYFAAIPAGQHGVGSGTFDTVGTPKRWLWPVLWILERQGVLFPVWERDVRFTVVNRPQLEADGHPAVTATRTFSTRARERRMLDEITTADGALVDYLGARRRYRAHLVASVEKGALTMSSTALAIRFGSAWLSVPRVLAPTVRLAEHFDDRSGRQHVSVTVTMPIVGRVYEYAGSFDYELRRDGGAE
jgi:hypothetical protein